MQNLGLENPILRKFRGKIEISSTHNCLCWKFAAVCRKSGTSCPACFFNPRRRCQESPCE